MNEKFFDLKKEKQDRMINAGLHIFAQNGYRHASTDEIVKEAQISKGLLFHYFNSKLGYYTFLYNYISRFVILQLRSEIKKQDIDYFDLHEQILDAETNLMEQYPFVFLFFESVKMEDDPDAILALEENSLETTVNDIYDSFERKADRTGYSRVKDFSSLSRMLHYVKIGLMREILADRSSTVSLYSAHAKIYLEELRTLAKE